MGAHRGPGAGRKVLGPLDQGVLVLGVRLWDRPVLDGALGAAVGPPECGGDEPHLASALVSKGYKRKEESEMNIKTRTHSQRLMTTIVECDGETTSRPLGLIQVKNKLCNANH